MKKQLLSLLLVFTMFLSILPLAEGASSASAANSDWAESAAAFSTYMMDTYSITTEENVPVPPDMRRGMVSVLEEYGGDFVREIVRQWLEDFGAKTFYLCVDAEAGTLYGQTLRTGDRIGVTLYGAKPQNAGILSHEFGHVIHFTFRMHDKSFDSKFTRFNAGRAYATPELPDDKLFFVHKALFEEDLVRLWDQLFQNNSDFTKTLTEAPALLNKSKLLFESCAKYIKKPSPIDYVGDIKLKEYTEDDKKTIVGGADYPATQAGLLAAIEATAPNGVIDIQKDITITRTLEITKPVVLKSSNVNPSKLIRGSAFQSDPMILTKTTSTFLAVEFNHIIIDGGNVPVPMSDRGIEVKTGITKIGSGTVLQNFSQTAVEAAMGTFRMASGSQIINNGGGVYINSNKGRLEMEGGTISNNKGGPGAGVFNSYGYVFLSGNATITGNTDADGKPSNAYLQSSQNFIVTGPLTGKIGVTHRDPPDTSRVKFIASGNGTYVLSEADFACFQMDSLVSPLPNKMLELAYGGTMGTTTDSAQNVVLRLVPDKITGIAFKSAVINLIVGRPSSYSARTVPSGGSGVITYTSSDPSVLEVVSTGGLMAKKLGTSTLSAVMGDFTASVQVNVVENPFTGITLAATPPGLAKGRTLQLSAAILPAGTEGTITYDSSDPNIASVSKTGLVTAKADGKVTITAKIDQFTASCDLNITTPIATSIALNHTAITVRSGTTIQIVATVLPEGAPAELKYSSEWINVAMIDKAGLITTGKPGTSIITVKSGKLTNTCEVTVLPPMGTLTDGPYTITCLGLPVMMLPSGLLELRKSATPTVFEITHKGDEIYNISTSPSMFLGITNSVKNGMGVALGEPRFDITWIFRKEADTNTFSMRFKQKKAMVVNVVNGLAKDGSRIGVTSSLEEELPPQAMFQFTPATSTTPTTPTAAATAAPSSTKLMVDGKSVNVDAYLISENNYIKLRDLAFILNGSAKNFNVTWDGPKNAINLISNSKYVTVKGDMTPGDKKNKSAAPTTSTIFVDGVETKLTAYLIGESNYFKLRDVMGVFGVAVGWDASTGTATLDTK